MRKKAASDRRKAVVNFVCQSDAVSRPKAASDTRTISVRRAPGRVLGAVLAAAADHGLGTVDEVHEPIVVLVAEIARVVPAVDEGGRGGVGLVPVADHHVRPADGELAHLASDDGALGADDLDVD